MLPETKGLIIGVIWTLCIIGTLYWGKKETEEVYTAEDAVENSWEKNR